jgi:hypothetical protein
MFARGITARQRHWFARETTLHPRISAFLPLRGEINARRALILNNEKNR